MGKKNSSQTRSRRRKLRTTDLPQKLPGTSCSRKKTRICRDHMIGTSLGSSTPPLVLAPRPLLVVAAAAVVTVVDVLRHLVLPEPCVWKGS